MNADQKSCDGATSSTNEQTALLILLLHIVDKNLSCHQPPVDFSILSRRDWNAVQIVGRDRVVLPSICRAPTHHMFPEEGKETCRWHLPLGNYVTPPAEEAASSCGQRDSPSPSPLTRRSPALQSHALFPFVVPSSHRRAAQQWRPWAALSRLEENFWGRITKRSVSRGDKALIDVAHSYAPSTSRPRPLPPYPSSALCKDIFKYSLPHQSRLSGSCSS